MKTSKHNLKIFHYISYGIIIITLLFVNSNTNLLGQYTSRDNYSGYWTENNSWADNISPGVSTSDTNIYCNGELIALNCLDIDKATLYVNDTLIINGNLELKNNARLEIGSQGVLLIYGDYTSNNEVEVINKGVFVVAGGFEMLGADNQGYFQNDSGSLFIFDPTPTVKKGVDYLSIECTDTGDYPSNCGFGNEKDLSVLPIYSFFRSLEFYARGIDPEANSCDYIDFVVDRQKGCRTDIFNYSLNSIGISDSDSLIWTFGDGAAPNIAYGMGPFEVNYSSVGYKSVSLQIVGNTTITKDNYVEIQSCLTYIDFSSSSNALCKGDSITFTAFADGLSISDTFNWDFGEGAIPRFFSGPVSKMLTAFSVSPPYGQIVQNVYYTTKGKKSVRLSVLGDTSITKNDFIDVKTCVSVDIQSNINQAHLNDKVIYTGVFTNLLSNDTVFWNFGEKANPQTAYGVGPHEVSYSSVGKKNVSVEILNDTSFTFNDFIEVIELKSIDFEADKNYVCIGDTINYSNLSTGLSKDDYLLWDFGEGAVPNNLSGNGPYSIVYETSGLKDISLTIILDTFEIKNAYVYVSTCKALDYKINKPKACIDDTLTFENTSFDGEGFDTLIWNFGEGANPQTAIGKGPHKIFYNVAGNKEFSLSTTSGIISETKVIDQIVIGEIPYTEQITVEEVSNYGTGTYLDEVCFKTSRTYSVSGDDGSTYNWSIPALNINEINNKNFNVNWNVDPGAYIIFVQEISKEKCYGTVSDAVVLVKECKNKEFNENINYTFTPNNDGFNDKWVIDNIEDYPFAKVYVFDRSGNVVFKSEGNYEKWDGTHKGKLLKLDSYYYLIDLSAYNKESIRGIVTLIR